MALDYDGAAADLYWIRALQHFGRERLAPPGARTHLRAAVSAAGSDDDAGSLFHIAYRFGAIFLGEAYPGGPGRPDLAIALLQKGLAAQPEKWQYMQDLGFVYYWHLQRLSDGRRHGFSARPRSRARPRGCARSPRSRSRRAGSAARRARSGSSSRKSEEPWLRDSAHAAPAQLDAMDAMDALDARVRDYG